MSAAFFPDVRFPCSLKRLFFRLPWKGDRLSPDIVKQGSRERERETGGKVREKQNLCATERERELKEGGVAERKKKKTEVEKKSGQRNCVTLLLTRIYFTFQKGTFSGNTFKIEIAVINESVLKICTSMHVI